MMHNCWRRIGSRKEERQASILALEGFIYLLRSPLKMLDAAHLLRILLFIFGRLAKSFLILIRPTIFCPFRYEYECELRRCSAYGASRSGTSSGCHAELRQPLFDHGTFEGIRCSTRPSYVSHDPPPHLHQTLPDQKLWMVGL